MSFRVGRDPGPIEDPVTLDGRFGMAHFGPAVLPFSRNPLFFKDPRDFEGGGGGLFSLFRSTDF